ncbi:MULTISPECIES: DUF6817 domain-containing protein [unclassified Anabaena]|uniref:DUF6817 domain-containing protein n=1 Tax=unclassified Anabaena TaxID=2619674 RepID=UPI0039C62082
MHLCAQTNIQLYAQANKLGYKTEDIYLISKAYTLTIEAFSGWFRPSGKTFISHLVGTASILINLKAPVDLVCAGLLHAIYAQGNLSSIKSQHLRQRIYLAFGAKTEEYIHKYTLLKWNHATLARVHEQFSILDNIDKDVLLIRLVNELEECGESKYLKYSSHEIAMMASMAEQLGFSEFASEIRVAFSKEHSDDDCSTIGQDLYAKRESGSYLVVPITCMKKPWLQGKNFLYRKLKPLLNLGV